MPFAFLQAAHGAAPGAGEVLTTQGGAIGWIWLAVLLPFAGFLANGALALWRPRAKAQSELRRSSDHSWAASVPSTTLSSRCASFSSRAGRPNGS